MYTCESTREAAREKLLAYIDNMDLAKEARLPTEDELCTLLGASRTTVRAVLEELIVEGRIIRQKGARSWVNAGYYSLKAILTPYHSIQQNIRAMGYTPRSRNLRTQILTPSKELAQALRIPPNGQVVRSTHVFYGDDHFCTLCYDFFDAATLTKEDIVQLNVETSSFFKVLFRKRGNKLSWDILQLSITDTMSMPELALYAGVDPHSRKPFLATHITAYDVNNYPVIHSDMFYDPDYITFGMVRRERYDFDDFQSKSYEMQKK